jgi:hypothetical protein
MSPRVARIGATVALAAVLFALSAGGQEFTLMTGSMDVVGTRSTSYAWSFEFRQRFWRHLDWTFSWVNEGHPPEHHRDGFTTQVWLTQPIGQGRGWLGVGVGPYRLFDTVPAGDGGSQDLDVWASMLSFTAGWRVSPRTTLRLTLNRVVTGRDIETHDYLFGVGWRLPRSEPGLAPLSGSPGTRDPRTVSEEVMAFAGASTVNTFHSETAVARGLEYRHGIGTYTDWTLSWINEGRPGPTERDGVAAQAWLENAYAHERLVLGVGAGPYAYLDKQKTEAGVGGNKRGVASLVTVTSSYRFGDRWFARLNWNRVVSFYNRDADVIVLGLGLTTTGGW